MRREKLEPPASRRRPLTDWGHKLFLLVLFSVIAWAMYAYPQLFAVP